APTNAMITGMNKIDINPPLYPLTALLPILKVNSFELIEYINIPNPISNPKIPYTITDFFTTVRMVIPLYTLNWLFAQISALAQFYSSILTDKME
ncbi:hypothetical protein, partial [Paenibacillus lupini]|uniref:hypothetical protein n=1 Tax=Paenibacillus lupini TaxID=1450204 RepID=UPI0039E8C77E